MSDKSIEAEPHKKAKIDEEYEPPVSEDSDESSLEVFSDEVGAEQEEIDEDDPENDPEIQHTRKLIEKYHVGPSLRSRKKSSLF